MEPFELTGVEAAARIAAGTLTCEELTRSCLARIAERDAVVRAWTWIEPDQAIRNARECDKRLVSAGSSGVLHGLPMGIKDVIDTADMPTQHNSPLYVGNRPDRDASCVRLARSSGALILGKTDTVEFTAGGRKALTTHPRNPRHTPGGSSSGSAAAVADGHVPLAMGTQTVGSTIRPASFTGIYGFKPTHGAVAWPGALQCSPSLDTLGWFGRSPACLTLVARAFRLRGLETRPAIRLDGVKAGLVRTHNWGKTEQGARDAVARAARLLEQAGVQVEELSLPKGFEDLDESLRIILQAESSVHFLPEYVGNPAGLHADFRATVEGGAAIPAETLLRAYDHAAQCRTQFDALFGPKLDMILAPAATGEAPAGLHTTGDWIMSAVWNVLHAPCIAIPGHTGPGGLPVGVQIVGPRYGDARLLALAETIGPLIDQTA
ncbi:MAG: amidase [Alphaproteobacteria bacterium]